MRKVKKVNKKSIKIFGTLTNKELIKTAHLLSDELSRRKIMYTMTFQNGENVCMHYGAPFLFVQDSAIKLLKHSLGIHTGRIKNKRAKK